MSNIIRPRSNFWAWVNRFVISRQSESATLYDSRSPSRRMAVAVLTFFGCFSSRCENNPKSVHPQQPNNTTQQQQQILYYLFIYFPFSDPLSLSHPLAVITFFVKQIKEDDEGERGENEIGMDGWMDGEGGGGFFPLRSDEQITCS